MAQPMEARPRPSSAHGAESAGGERALRTANEFIADGGTEHHAVQLIREQVSVLVPGDREGARELVFR